MHYKTIGSIGNYYGGLLVMEHQEKYYWCIEDWNSDIDNLSEWEEISQELYNSLITYQEKFHKQSIK